MKYSVNPVMEKMKFIKANKLTKKQVIQFEAMPNKPLQTLEGRQQILEILGKQLTK